MTLEEAHKEAVIALAAKATDFRKSADEMPQLRELADTVKQKAINASSAMGMLDRFNELYWILGPYKTDTRK